MTVFYSGDHRPGRYLASRTPLFGLCGYQLYHSADLRLPFEIKWLLPVITPTSLHKISTARCNDFTARSNFLLYNFLSRPTPYSHKVLRYTTADSDSVFSWENIVPATRRTNVRSNHNWKRSKSVALPSFESNSTSRVPSYSSQRCPAVWDRATVAPITVTCTP